MRCKGGQVLIKIDKELGVITKDDFDMNVIKEIRKAHKPVILECSSGIYVCDVSFAAEDFFIDKYVTLSFDENGDLDGYSKIELYYQSGELTYTFVEF